VNRPLAALRTLLTLAHEEWGWLDAGPGIKPTAQHRNFREVAALRQQPEASSGCEQGAAVVHRYSIT
jgi:hypothetical protein